MEFSSVRLKILKIPLAYHFDQIKISLGQLTSLSVIIPYLVSDKDIICLMDEFVNVYDLSGYVDPTVTFHEERSHHQRLHHELTVLWLGNHVQYPLNLQGKLEFSRCHLWGKIPAHQSIRVSLFSYRHPKI